MVFKQLEQVYSFADTMERIKSKDLKRLNDHNKKKFYVDLFH